MKPSSVTLKAMFGDDTPIGAFSERRFQEELAKLNTTDDFVKAICDYAQGIHEEQYDYYMVSPYGGEDITVESIDSLALQRVAEVFPLLSKKGIQISMQNFEDAVCAELAHRKIPLNFVNDFINTYTQMQKAEVFIQDEMQQYSKDIDSYDKNLQQEIVALRQQGEQELNVLNEQFSKLQSHKIRNFFFPKKYQMQASLLSSAIDNAHQKASMDKRTIYTITGLDVFDRDMPFPPMFQIHYCAEIAEFAEKNGFSNLVNGDDYIIDISNPQKQSALIDLSHKFTAEPAIQQKFDRYSALISRQADRQKENKSLKKSSHKKDTPCL